MLRVDEWRQIGRRGGLGGVADRLRARLARSIAPGLAGERRAVLEGIVLGDDDGAVRRPARRDFRASGLYHLLAVSGQNVVAGRRRRARCSRGSLGISRWLGELGALAAIAAYVLAVGPQPSVIRAGIAGCARLARLARRPAARRLVRVLLVGAVVAARLEPVPRLRPGLPALVRRGRGDLHARAADLARGSRATRCRGTLAAAVAVSTACGARDRADPVAPVRRAAAAQASPRTRSPSRRCRRCSASRSRRPRVDAVSPSGGRGRSPGSNGWVAAYIALCARAIGSLPFAQVHDRTAALAALARRRSRSPPMLGGDGGRAEAGLPDRRQRPAEGRPRGRSGCAAGSTPTRSSSLCRATRAGDDAVAACNALGLFAGDGRLIVVEGVEAWKAADAKAIAAYLKAPAPATTLALVGGELKKDAPLAKAVAPTGELLALGRRRSKALAALGRRAVQAARRRRPSRRPAARWSSSSATTSTSSRARSTSSRPGRPASAVTAADVEALVARAPRRRNFALTDAWGARDVGGVLARGRALLERTRRPALADDPALVGILTSHVARVRACQALDAEGLVGRRTPRRGSSGTRSTSQKLYAQARNFSRRRAARPRRSGSPSSTTRSRAARGSPAELELERALDRDHRAAGAASRLRELG